MILPVASTAAVLAVVGVLALTLGFNKSSALSNTQLLALVHSASTGLDRAPATTFTMTMEISGGGQHETITMSGASITHTRSASFTMTGPGVSESAINVDGVSYIQVPPSAVSRNSGKQWLGVRTPEPTGAEQQLASNGPESMLSALATVGGTVEDEGSESVRGVATTKYSVHVDVLKLLGPNFSQVMGPDSTAAISRLGLDHLPMTIWLDDQGITRKLTMSFAFNGFSMAETAYITPTDTLPKITAPAASQVRMVNSLTDFGNEFRSLSGVS